MKELITIWDLDGVLADSTHRIHHILCAKPDWFAFHALTHLDTVISPSLLLYLGLQKLGIKTAICTSRSEMARVATDEWFVENRITYDLFLMRPDDDHRKSEEVKSDMLITLQLHYHVSMAFEDQPSVVEMYRKAGVLTWAADDKNWRNGTYNDVKPILEISPFVGEPSPRTKITSLPPNVVDINSARKQS